MSYIPDRYIFEPIEDLVYYVFDVLDGGVSRPLREAVWEGMGHVTADVDNIPFRDRFLEDANA